MLSFTYQNSPLPNLSSLKNTIQLSFNILGLEKMFTSKVDTIFNNLLPSEQIAKSTLTDYDL